MSPSALASWNVNLKESLKKLNGTVLARLDPQIAGVPFQGVEVGVGGVRGKLNRWGLASSRTRVGALSSVSYTEVPCGVSFEERHCPFMDIYKALGQSTIFPCFSGLKR